MKTNRDVSDTHLKIAMAFERALSHKPVEEQLAASLVAKNVLNGCSWEFCRMDPQLRRYEEEFANSNTCRLQKVTYNRLMGIKGYLLYIKMDRLLDLLGPDNRGPLNVSDLELAKQHRKEARRALVERLKSGYVGKIGIFSTNDSQTITINGKTIPAYAVTLKELCELCQKAGYGIVVGNQTREPKQILEHEDEVIECLLLAPSSNALIIDIAPVKSVQMLNN